MRTQRVHGNKGLKRDHNINQCCAAILSSSCLHNLSQTYNELVRKKSVFKQDIYAFNPTY